MHKGTLERVSFPNYENFNNPDIAYSNFFSKFNCVIKTIAPFNTVKNKKMQVNGLMEKLQKKYTHETNCTKIQINKRAC